MSENRKDIKVKVHAARDAKSRIIWAEVVVNGYPAGNLADLQRLTGKKASLRWVLHSPAGSVQVPENDPRIEQEGFLLRLSDKGIRSDMQAECLIVE